MPRFLRISAVEFVCVLTVALAAAQPGGATLPVLGRRASLYKLPVGDSASIEALGTALGDPSGIVRRTAVRLLLNAGPGAEKALAAALNNSDIVVRRTALRGICILLGAKAAPHLAKALVDPDPTVRRVAIDQLVAMKPRTGEVNKLLRAAQKSEDKGIRAAAIRTTWPFHRDTKLIRDRTDYDHQVTLVKTIKLPIDDWRFRLDRARDGHLKKWYKPDFVDSKWKTIAIEQVWQKAGYDYVGVSWYRRTIDLPPTMKHVAVEIHFEGVDESAWVWVNGIYVGQQDIGPLGWDVPFGLDITKEIKWDGPNQITVRVMNTNHGGGIWRPVRIEILK
ncbi:MAG: HEAT repeat domain-containing protein [Lentisphaeria bacterium]|nr:HEAT repeat domain-containing protein [Lentisphaeria bacterium]